VTTPSPLGVLSTVNGYPNRQHKSTLGASVQFCVSGTGWGTGVPPWGPPPHPGTAVHGLGYTALHWAAMRGNRRIVRSLVDANADVNAQNDSGCAVCACGESAECAGRVPAAVGCAGTRRCTWPRSMAIPHPSRSCCCAAPTGPSRTATGTAALRRTAEIENRSSPSRRTPKQYAERCGKLAHYEVGVSQVQPARRLTRTPPPPRPPPPPPSQRCWCRRMRRRCSP
jgi:hypothetical protein